MQRIFVALLFVSAVFVWAADKFQPLNIKTGLWEVTMNSKPSGSMPIPPNTVTYKSCLTKEELEKGPTFNQGDMQCTQTILTSSPTRLEMKMACQGQEMSGSGTMQVVALSQESAKASGQMTMSAGGQTMNNNITITSKWIGPNCGDVH
jgi:uncharacterized protein DUF3617